MAKTPSREAARGWLPAPLKELGPLLGLSLQTPGSPRGWPGLPRPESTLPLPSRFLPLRAVLTPTPQRWAQTVALVCQAHPRPFAFEAISLSTGRKISCFQITKVSLREVGKIPQHIGEGVLI